MLVFLFVEFAAKLFKLLFIFVQKKKKLTLWIKIDCTT